MHNKEKFYCASFGSYCMLVYISFIGCQGSRMVGLKKTYLEQSKVPKVICQNCLNRLHKLCCDRFAEDSTHCDCNSKFGHIDYSWQLTKTQYNRLHKIKKVKRTKTGKQIERSINKRLDAIAQDLCRYIVKERAGWQCQLAGKDNIHCSQGKPKEIMQWAHIITRGASKTLKFLLDNGLCICSGHHKYYTHQVTLWNELIAKLFPRQWNIVNELKWKKTPTDFSYIDTIKNLTLEASKLKRGIKL